MMGMQTQSLYLQNHCLSKSERRRLPRSPPAPWRNVVGGETNYAVTIISCQTKACYVTQYWKYFIFDVNISVTIKRIIHVSFTVSKSWDETTKIRRLLCSLFSVKHTVWYKMCYLVYCVTQKHYTVIYFTTAGKVYWNKPLFVNLKRTLFILWILNL